MNTLSSNQTVTARAFRMPEVVDASGKTLIPVVVHAKAIHDLHHPETTKPVKIHLIIDRSSNMGKPIGKNAESRLGLVKKTIINLATQLPENTEYVLRTYDGEKEVINSQTELIKKITSLKVDVRQDPDIYSPLLATKDQIAPEYQIDPKCKNLILVFSDKNHVNPKLKELAKDLSQYNTAIYLAGLGTSYDEALTRDILKSTGFGGMAHLGTDSESFKNLVVDFVNQMSKALVFPVINFNSWFDKVINIFPSMREIEKDAANYPAVVGYQNQAYAVGFIDKDKQLDQAKIQVGIKGTDNELLTEVEIGDKQAINDLDEAQQGLIAKLPLRALTRDLVNNLGNTNAAPLRFLKRNFEISDESLKQILINLAAELMPGGEIQGPSFRENLSHLDSLTQIETIKTVKQETIGHDTYDTISPNQNSANPKPLGPSVRIGFDIAGAKNGFSLTNRSFTLNESQSISIGKHPNNDVVVQYKKSSDKESSKLDSISQMQCRITAKDGKLYLSDGSVECASKSGTAIISSDALLKRVIWDGQEIEINNNDSLLLGKHLSLQVKLKQS